QQALPAIGAGERQASIGHPGEGGVSRPSRHALSKQPHPVDAGEPGLERRPIVAPPRATRGTRSAGLPIRRHGIDDAATAGLEEGAELVRAEAHERLESEPAELAAEGGDDERGDTNRPRPPPPSRRGPPRAAMRWRFSSA